MPSYSSLESKSSTLSSGILSLPGTIGPSTSGPSVVPLCIFDCSSTVSFVEPVTLATIWCCSVVIEPEPTSLYVYADGKVRTDIADWFTNNIDLTPLGIINKFDLFNSIYV